ncbi:hypothetical protein [uncultured Clostridium sp.]|jgi:hypothetical protein|uniref:hypothetical protein n=1 Tax=uncultured Clostridium sp. TaxID=59620 RepID=UPI002636D2E7|nr:hypothetical protein [uncultured Clostridium sp.]
MNEKIEVLNTANEYLVNLKGGIENLVLLMNEEKEQQGCSIISEVAEGIGWILDVARLTSDIIGEAEGIDEMDNFLSEIVEALENEDYILVSDLFNYEVLPVLENLHEVIKTKVLN